ncbi:MAG: hypothetical protein AAFQ02_11805 [Bacteroidota bacterium]
MVGLRSQFGEAATQNIIESHPTKATELRIAYEEWWNDIIEDASIDNLISVGHPSENPTFLTAHDWHATDDSPWNQTIIRNAKICNGYWLLNVETSGKYTIKLYRYPPSTNYSYNQDIAPGDKVDGGTPYPMGKGINLISSKIRVNESEYISQEAVDDTYFEYKINLNSGRTRFQSWMTQKNGISLGSYYVTLERT